MAEKDDLGFLYHIMKQKQNELSKTILGFANELLSEKYADGIIPMTETRIYVGLNDAETKKQRFKTDKYMGVLKKVCQNYHVAFSVDIEEGGYFHEDGTYTEENSFILLLIDTDREIVQKIAKDLCVFFGQESVLVTENHLDGYFVSEELPFNKQ